jgi:galactokinase
VPDPDAASLLLSRSRAELAAQFDFAKSFQITSAPGSLDVMGGISADDAGAHACQLAVDQFSAALVQERLEDRDLQVFSFDLYDQHLPFTFRIPLPALAATNPQTVRRELAEPGRKWAADVVGCLLLLHHRRLTDLSSIGHGLNIALHSAIREEDGLGARAAHTVAVMRGLVELLSLRGTRDSCELAVMCSEISQAFGSAGGVCETLTSLVGSNAGMLRIECQPCSLLPPVLLPDGFEIIAIASGAPSIDVERRTQRLRFAAGIGQRLIFEKMREMGRAAGREMTSDPMRGYLANLDPEDYKRFFRQHLPATMRGSEFVARFGSLLASPLPAFALSIPLEESVEYAVLGAVDHHVLEAGRVRRFCEFIAQSRSMPLEDKRRFIEMDKAGHLMYASHHSYMNDARLGHEACDLLVNLVRAREKSGLYGARMTARGCGGTVAVLAERSSAAKAAIEQILLEYRQRSGNEPELVPLNA